MSSSITRYLPGLAGRMEPGTQVLKDRTASPRDGGSSSQFTGNIGTAQSLSDEALIALICKRDSDAFAGLFRRYARLVRGMALRVLKDPSEADDLLQDIFILIHRLCGTFDSSKGSAQFWILQMTYRRAISRRRYLNSRHFYTRVELDEEAIHAVEPRSGDRDAPSDKCLAELDLQKLFGDPVRRPAENPSTAFHRRLHAR